MEHVNISWVNYTVHGYEHVGLSRDWVNSKFERLGDQKADSCTNPQNQALAAAHLSQILQKSYCCSENTKCTMVTMQMRCNSSKKYLKNAKKIDKLDAQGE